jgi:hypothetical protein
MMPRLAKVKVTRQLLEQALGFKWTWKIVAAQMSHDNYMDSTLELIVEGEQLPEEFTVIAQGQPIKEGLITVHVERTTTSITPIKE